MRTKRYLILPIDGIRISDSSIPVPSSARKLLATLQLTPTDVAATKKLAKSLVATVRTASSAVRRAIASNESPASGPAIEVIQSLHEDGVKLVSASEEVMAALRQENPGIRIIEEKFCHPARAPRVPVPPRPAKPAGARAAAATSTSVVVEVLRGDTMKPIKGADVIAFRTSKDAFKKKTNASGKATFTFAAAVSKLKNVYVYHEEPGVWGYFKANVKVTSGSVKVILAPLDLATDDSLRFFHKAGNLTDGAGVRVGVIDSGVDINHINLSLGFDPGVTDDAISDALSKARKNGILAVAAAGNDGRLPVGFPGSDSACVGVSAVGRKGSYPNTSTDVQDEVAPFGTDPKNYIAGFSNVGADLDAAGSGVAVVSTFPGGYGPMSGTSMASPAVAGMAARLLASNPAVLSMPRDAARSDAVRKLVIDACKSLGFGVLLEGAGLPQ